jgi:hypothetical protein
MNKHRGEFPRGYRRLPGITSPQSGAECDLADRKAFNRHSHQLGVFGALMTCVCRRRWDLVGLELEAYGSHYLDFGSYLTT